MAHTVETYGGVYNRERYLKLKAAYDKAVTANKTEFTFEGFQLLTQFAKYLLEFLKNYLDK